MSIGKFIRARLTGNATVTGLVGNRIFPVIMPQNAAYPAIVYTITGEPKDQSHTGAGSIDQITVNFNIWGDDYDVNEEIFAALRAALDYVPGTAGGETVQGVRIGTWRDGIDESLEHFLRTVAYHFRYVN